MDIHVIAAPPTRATAHATIPTLRSNWPDARVLLLPAGIASHSEPYRPPDLAIILHDRASPETPADIAAIRTISACPIVVIGPGIPEQAEIECLHHGADIVLARPLSTPRLLAILGSLLRRAGDGGSPSGHIRAVGDLTLDVANGLLLVGSDPVNVTPTESRLLEALAGQVGSCVSSSELMREVWGLENDDVRKSLKVHVSRLRNKLAGAGSTWTVRGMRRNGYMLVEDK